MTVAAAFNIVRNKGSATESIDQLTSRLNFSSLTISTGTRTPSSASLSASPASNNSIILSRKDSVGSISPVAITKKNQRTKGKADKANRTVPKGKKRALADTTTTTQARTEDANKSCADREVKEKILNAKLKDGNRAKSPEAKPRTKRASTQQLEDSQPKKRVRATSEAASCSNTV